MGAWIETQTNVNLTPFITSHPTWVRGLKREKRFVSRYVVPVAPYVGAWIETTGRPACTLPSLVAPYVGAWIETTEYSATYAWYLSHPTWVRGLKQINVQVNIGMDRSHPTWVRGLKLLHSAPHPAPQCVAPYVGAWIETLLTR